MKFSEVIKYYEKRSIREIMVEEAKNREVVWRFANGNFGKRPSVLLNENDIIQIVKRGAVSFHCSVERWENPLLLRTDMKKKEMDEIRIGWDLLLDIDSPNLEISKILANLIIRALEDHGIENYGIKFSGNKGFHIIVPFESFPQEIDGNLVKNMFPDLARIVGEYIFEYVKERFEEEITRGFDVDDLIKMTGKSYEEIVKDGKIVVENLCEIDTMMMSRRHLFRMPYSLNEKSWLVSVPIKSIRNFDIEEAKPEYVEGELKFIPEGRENEAKYLFEVAYEWYSIKKIEFKIDAGKTVTIKIKGKIPEEFFPPCIKNMLAGLEDGRKRALFIITNFLLRLGYDIDEVEKRIWEWNERNEPPLKESYVRSQMKWHRKLKEPYMPPNCDNDKYYKDMRVCTPDDLCKTIKNPLTYALRRYREWLRKQVREKSRKS